MDNTNKLTNLDELLLKLMFQVHQDSQHRKQEKQQIQINEANIVKVKQRRNELFERNNQLDAEINRMQKISTHSEDNSKVWKPTSMFLTQHEEHVQTELQKKHAAVEGDIEMYQDHLNHYRAILQQHQSQYSEFPEAKEYFKKKAEFEEIQNRVLDCTEQIQQKTKIHNDLSEPSLFGSLREWALEIAALKVDTQNVLNQVEYTQEKAVQEQYENQESPAQFDNFESSEGINVPDFGNLSNNVTPKEQKQSICQKKEYTIALKPTVNSEQIQPQNVVTYCQKSLTLKPFELMLEQSKTDTELEKNNNLQTNNVIVAHVDSAQPECQRNVELQGVQQQTSFHITSATKSHGQIQYRSLVPKNQTETLQWLQSTATTSATSDTDEMNSSQSKSYIRSDSLYKSPAPIVLKSVNNAQGETTNKTPQMFPRTPEYTGPSQKQFEMDNNPQHEKTSSESPGFSFLGVSTPKTPGFDMFGRLAFGFPDTPEETNDRQMAGNQFEFSSLFFKKTPEKDYTSNLTCNSQSPQRDIGLESPSNEQPFTFSFQSDNNFGDSKDEFNFGFSSAQNQSSSQQGVFKFF